MLCNPHKKKKKKKKQQLSKLSQKHHPSPSPASYNSLSPKPPPGNDVLRVPSLHHTQTAPIFGPRLHGLLEILHSAIKMEIGAAKESLPSKVVMRKCKIFFYIGVNNVTRALERMPLVQKKPIQKELADLGTKNESVQAELGSNGKNRWDAELEKSISSLSTTPHIQAVLAASDVHPRLLISHLPDLAASRNVPLLTISGGGGTGSMRLGEIFNVRTAIAVALKNGDSAINAVMKSFLDGSY